MSRTNPANTCDTLSKGVKEKHQSINQSINQATDQSINQSINKPINQSIAQSINRVGANHSMPQSINQSIDQIRPSIEQTCYTFFPSSLFDFFFQFSTETYSSLFKERGQHDDQRRLLLPDHLPKVGRGMGKRSLGGNVPIHNARGRNFHLQKNKT